MIFTRRIQLEYELAFPARTAMKLGNQDFMSDAYNSSDSSFLVDRPCLTPASPLSLSLVSLPSAQVTSSPASCISLSSLTSWLAMEAASCWNSCTAHSAPPTMCGRASREGMYSSILSLGKCVFLLLFFVVLSCFCLLVLFCVYLLYCVCLYCVCLYCVCLYCVCLYCVCLYCVCLYCVCLHCVCLYCIVSACLVLCLLVLYCVCLYCVVFLWSCLFVFNSSPICTWWPGLMPASLR